MFSYFYGGIKNKYPKRHFDLPTLVRLIKNNPEKFKIEKVRELRRTGRDYDYLKNSLPYITPNCLVKVRNLKESEFNLITPSSFIYFDIDDYGNAKQLKDRFIKEYGHLASLICLSCSKGGISIFFKVSNHLKNEDDFLIARQYIIDNILVNEKIDTNAGGIARAMFISSDPDLFYNFENEIDIPLQVFKNKKPRLKKCLIEDKKNKEYVVHSDCTLLESFVPTPIKEVLEQLIFETPVDVINPIVDYKEVQFVEIRFSYIIKDGLKHKTFTDITHKLIYLNPKADRQLLLSYLYHVNRECTGNKQMNDKELIRLFDMVYDGVKIHGDTNVKSKSKFIHYNKESQSEFNKRVVSGLINGAIKKNKTKKKIEDAIKEMEELKIKISILGISKYTGIHRDTIKKRMNTPYDDIGDFIKEINDSIE